MTDIAVKEKIKQFVEHHLGGASIDDDENIFEKGYVNSLFAMQLVLHVEQEFGITVDNDDLEMSNFSSISALSQFVKSKKNLTT